MIKLMVRVVILKSAYYGRAAQMISTCQESFSSI